VLDGEKIYITNAPIADLFVVLAATGPHTAPLGTSLLAVPACTPGVQVVEARRKLGLHGSPTGCVRFEGVRLLGFAHVDACQSVIARCVELAGIGALLDGRP
jgi:acyl-CoA dehydrogenase